MEDHRLPHGHDELIVRLPTSGAWFLAFLVGVYLFFTEVLLIGGINLGLLTESLLLRFGLGGIWSAISSLAIFALATSLIALVFTSGIRNRTSRSPSGESG